MDQILPKYVVQYIAKNNFFIEDPTALYWSEEFGWSIIQIANLYDDFNAAETVLISLIQQNIVDYGTVETIYSLIREQL